MLSPFVCMLTFVYSHLIVPRFLFECTTYLSINRLLRFLFLIHFSYDQLVTSR